MGLYKGGKVRGRLRVGMLAVLVVAAAFLSWDVAVMAAEARAVKAKARPLP